MRAVRGAQRLPNQIQRPPFDLVEDAGDIFTHDANRNQVNTREEQQNRDDGRPATYRILVEQVFADDVETVGERTD